MSYEEIKRQYEVPDYFGNISDPGVNLERAVWFRDYFKLPEGSTVLELGAGKFTLTQAWRKLGMQAWGIDWSEFACTHEPNVSVRAMCQFLPFKDKSFDLVTGFDVFEHIPPNDLATAAADMVRVCRKFAALNIPIEDPDPNDHHHLSKLSRAEWEALFEKDFTQDHPADRVAGFNNNSTVHVLRMREL